MRVLERVELFDRSGAFVFAALAFLIAFVSLAWEYYGYRELTRFDDPLVRAAVIDQEVRLIGDMPKTSIKFRLEGGAAVRSAMSPYLRDLRGREVLLELKVKHLSFLDYLRGFRAQAVIEEVYPPLSLKEKGYRAIVSMHDDIWMKELYGALFVATPFSQELQELVGAMGLSHILSISGYHYGIITLIIYFLLRRPYGWVQSRYFPYRHGHRDLFGVVAAVLFAYLWALEFNPAMVRAFGMLVVGYWLYDRGIRIVSFQTLLIAVILLLAFWPRLFFALGFWFSAFGVLSIFVFLRHYEHWKPWQIFLVLHVWCYLVLLPVSLAVFGKFGWAHIASIPLALLFNLYYPLVAALHLTPWASWFDPYLIALFEWGDVRTVYVPMWAGIASVVLALAAMVRKEAFWALGVTGGAVFGGAVYQIT
ncbi:MAG: ComEC/Rec2 family competence protein [Sulfuricurvum sp.]|jgi:competence protein ComEC|nr:ComEC/Rec2 family competence protein [Sulfuricurvum sp.]